MFINIYDAKTRFSQLIIQALKGEEIIIARDGKPLVRLVPYTEEPEARKGGQFKGLLQMSDDFDAPLPDDLLKLFYGEK
jgi:prevent-host-death family protein